MAHPDKCWFCGLHAELNGEFCFNCGEWTNRGTGEPLVASHGPDITGGWEGTYPDPWQWRRSAPSNRPASAEQVDQGYQ